MLDQYRYVRMEVDSMVTSENGVEASVKWRHLAIRKGDNLMFPIEEVSALLKTEGKWTYVKGDVVRPDPEMSQVMMSDWPAMIGLELKVDEEKAKDWLSKGAQPSDTVARLFRQIGILPTGK